MTNSSKNINIISGFRKNLKLEDAKEKIKSMYDICHEVVSSDNDSIFSVSELKGSDFPYFSNVSISSLNKIIYAEFSTDFTLNDFTLTNINKSDFFERLLVLNYEKNIVFGSIDKKNDTLSIKSRMYCNDLDDLSNFIESSSELSCDYIDSIDLVASTSNEEV